MSNKIEEKCPENQYRVHVGNGVWDCIPGNVSAEFIDDGYDGPLCAPEEEIKWHGDKGSASYCVPCQTIEYVCPRSNISKRKQKICPNQKNANGTIKTYTQAYTEADLEIDKIMKKGCRIITPGYFFNKQEELLKARENQAKENGAEQKPAPRPQQKAEAFPEK